MDNLNKDTELDNTNKKLNISDVRNSIQERIKKHEQDILNCLDTIKQNGDWTRKIKQMTELIDNSEIRISELKLVLEYCF
jgi:hypothetical protein